jgi:hypothetical protein
MKDLLESAVVSYEVVCSITRYSGLSRMLLMLFIQQGDDDVVDEDDYGSADEDEIPSDEE